MNLLNRKSNKIFILVCVISFVFALIFSYLSIRRIHVLWASYFDLGIMHQTVYNTYMAIKHFEWSRILELTDPHGSGLQIYRMAIHADVLLALLAPLYFIHNGSETLVVVQAFFVASGGIALYFIAKKVLFDRKDPLSSCEECNTNRIDNHKNSLIYIIPLLIPISYFLYAPLHRSLLYEFHAVTLATPLVLWLYLAYLYRKWIAVTVLTVFLLLSKEQVGFGLSVFFFISAIKSMWLARNQQARPHKILHRNKEGTILLLSALGSLLYVVIMVFILMPLFRLGESHFALNYFHKGTSSNLLHTLFSHVTQLAGTNTLLYTITLLGPVAILPLISIYTLPALPEFLINVLSNNSNMRNIYFHYTAYITPWLYLGLIDVFRKLSMYKHVWLIKFAISILIVCTLGFSYQFSPLPYSKTGSNSWEIKEHPASQDVALWQQILASDTIKVSTTGHLAPHFSGRRYFYDFGKNYIKADYVLLMVNAQSNKVDTYGNANEIRNAYTSLTQSTEFEKVYERGNMQVYKKLP